MLLARVIGTTTATIKHVTLRGQKMLLAQPVQSLTREPVIVLDRLGATRGDLVVITSDGRGAREFVGADDSPVRWTTVGLVDRGQNVDTGSRGVLSELAGLPGAEAGE